MRVEDAERVARAGGQPAVQLVLGLLAEVAALRGRVDEHERPLKRDSTNSALRPSRDPPLARQHCSALARECAKASSRQPGGQPGHERKARSRRPTVSMSAFNICPTGAGAGTCSTAGRSVGRPGRRSELGAPGHHAAGGRAPAVASGVPVLRQEHARRVARRGVELGVRPAPGGAYRGVRRRVPAACTLTPRH